MKRSTKIISIIILFFFIIASVIVARTMIGKHFQKKFGKRPPPGIMVTEVIDKEFSEKIERAHISCYDLWQALLKVVTQKGVQGDCIPGALQQELGI